MKLGVLGDRAAFLTDRSPVGTVDLISEHNLFVFFYSLVALTRMRFKSIKPADARHRRGQLISRRC
jgi:hypothetical protein